MAVIHMNNINEDEDMFQGVHNVSLSTIARVIKKHSLSMKEIYRVPFERNSERVKELRYQYVQAIMELDASIRPVKYIFVDEAGFNLCKEHLRGRNIIGQRATVDTPGQRGGNLTIWKVYDHHPYDGVTLLQAMEGACDDIGEEACQGWIRHSRHIHSGTLSNYVSATSASSTKM
ncbi:hypothetical protein AOXY_G17592 [Acipenser oxyrinchus oxyrinchus]|uniref:Tc1-like transposase DDE domain-containing protein n=1 Tax=Acipenser oxyrinchus oxyrinchus TaxID=40147 RepID=A0AAD8D312_ACIOX|nr:hypothetical protein AOXY_G17592 [Acipenser oxyrinchus oxyrinchus]